MKKILLSIAIIFYLNACTLFVEDLNTNPNYFQEADTQVLLNHACLNVASVCEANPARLACMFTDQMRGTDRQYTSYDKYNVISKDFNEIWDDIFQSGIAQVLLAKQQSKAEDDKIKEGIALILEAYYFGEASALFGNIPFNQVNQAEEYPNPVFDEQEFIFNVLHEKLDEAIGLVNDVKVTIPVFETQSTWGRVAHALKARYYLLTKSYDLAIQESLLAFQNTDEGLYIKHSPENFSENLFWQFEVKVRGGYLSFNNSFLQQLLTPENIVYKGNNKTDESNRLNYYLASDLVKYNTAQDGLFSIDAKFPVISYEEVQLILAESYYREGKQELAIDALNRVREEWENKYAAVYDNYILSDFMNDEDLLHEILVEKYVSVIGLPSFYDVNRTKNFIGVPIKNETLTNIIPQRFLYPETEAFSNQNFPGYKNLFDPIPLNQ